MPKQHKNTLLRIWQECPLWQKILWGGGIGIIVGLLMGPHVIWIKPLGTLFINAIKMLIVPLVFCSLVFGVTALRDGAEIGRVSLKAFLLYFATTAAAISVGLITAHILQPGKGMQLVATISDTAEQTPSLTERLISLIPINPVAALADGNILQIIVFALFLGTALNLIGAKAKPAIMLFKSLAETMYKLTAIIMSFAPYGVLALMAWVTGTYGLDVLGHLMWLIVAVYIACIIQIYGVYSGTIKLFSKLKVRYFFRGIINAQTIAYATSSSSGTLPISLRCANEQLGITKGISSFILPLGATINMDGTAIYQGVCALFIAQAFGVELQMVDYFTIITTGTLASIGTAGIPGAGLIMLSMVLSAVGLPMEGIALLAGIDRILDMARTAVNVSGDLMVTTVVANSEGELDTAIYHGQTASAVNQ